MNGKSYFAIDLADHVRQRYAGSSSDPTYISGSGVMVTGFLNYGIVTLDGSSNTFGGSRLLIGCRGMSANALESLQSCRRTTQTSTMPVDTARFVLAAAKTSSRLACVFAYQRMRSSGLALSVHCSQAQYYGISPDYLAVHATITGTSNTLSAYAGQSISVSGSGNIVTFLPESAYSPDNIGVVAGGAIGYVQNPGTYSVRQCQIPRRNCNSAEH